MIFMNDGLINTDEFELVDFRITDRSYDRKWKAI